MFKDRDKGKKYIHSLLRMDIRGAFAKPDWKDVLWVQLVILPYTIFM